MKIAALALAAAFALGSLGAVPAAAQPDRHHDTRMQSDNGRHDGWRRDDARRDNGRHYGWRNHRRHRVCHYVWRHHHRERICRWVRR